MHSSASERFVPISAGGLTVSQSRWPRRRSRSNEVASPVAAASSAISRRLALQPSYSLPSLRRGLISARIECHFVTSNIDIRLDRSTHYSPHADFQFQIIAHRAKGFLHFQCPRQHLFAAASHRRAVATTSAGICRRSRQTRWKVDTARLSFLRWHRIDHERPVCTRSLLCGSAVRAPDLTDCGRGKTLPSLDS